MAAGAGAGAGAGSGGHNTGSVNILSPRPPTRTGVTFSAVSGSLGIEDSDEYEDDDDLAGLVARLKLEPRPDRPSPDFTTELVDTTFRVHDDDI